MAMALSFFYVFVAMRQGSLSVSLTLFVFPERCMRIIVNFPPTTKTNHSTLQHYSKSRTYFLNFAKNFCPPFPSFIEGFAPIGIFDKWVDIHGESWKQFSVQHSGVGQYEWIQLREDNQFYGPYLLVSFYVLNHDTLLS